MGWFLKEIASRERPILRLSEYAQLSAPPPNRKMPRIFSWFAFESEEGNSLVIQTAASRFKVQLEGLAWAMMVRAFDAHEANGGKRTDLITSEESALQRINGHGIPLWMVVHPLNGECAVVLPSWEAVRCVKGVEGGKDFPYSL